MPNMPHSCDEYCTGEHLHGSLPGLVFLDLSKAFDTLDHNIMLHELTSLGMNRSVVEWFRSYLTKQTPKSVCTDEATSAPQSICFGVQQEGVLAIPTSYFISSI